LTVVPNKVAVGKKFLLEKGGKGLGLKFESALAKISCLSNWSQHF
jgi:hypothetical protein